jgi:hypothetical protein
MKAKWIVIAWVVLVTVIWWSRYQPANLNAGKALPAGDPVSRALKGPEPMTPEQRDVLSGKAFRDRYPNLCYEALHKPERFITYEDYETRKLCSGE